MGELIKLDSKLVKIRVTNPIYDGPDACCAHGLVIQSNSIDAQFDATEHSIQLYSDCIFERGDLIPITFNTKDAEKPYNTYYKANYISTDIDRNICIIKEFMVNDTSIYIMPLLGGNRQYWQWDNYLINAYIDYECMATVNLLYRYTPYLGYAKLQEDLINTDGFIGTEKYKDDRFDLYKFHIKEELWPSLQCILNSEYSRISNRHKGLIQKFHNYRETDIPMAVVNKSNWYMRQLCNLYGLKTPSEIEAVNELKGKFKYEGEVLK